MIQKYLLIIILAGLLGFIVGLHFSIIFDYMHDKITSARKD